MPATYALPGVLGDASMVLMRTKSGASRGVTSSQPAPPSRVTCTSPSSDPTQITSASWYEGAMAKTVAYVSTPVWSLVSGPPDGPIVDGSARVKSGLICSQDAPSLVVFQTFCVPVYRTSGAR